MSNQIFDKKKFCEESHMEQSYYRICKKVGDSIYQQIKEEETKELSNFFLMPLFEDSELNSFQIIRKKDGTFDSIYIHKAKQIVPPFNQMIQFSFFDKLKYYLKYYFTYPYNYFKNKKDMKELQSLDFFGVQKQKFNDKIIEMKSCIFNLKNNFSSDNNCINDLNKLKSLISELQNNMKK